MKLPRFNVNRNTGDVFADPEGEFVLFRDAQDNAAQVINQAIHLAQQINSMAINAGLITEPTMDVVQLGLLCEDVTKHFVNPKKEAGSEKN